MKITCINIYFGSGFFIYFIFVSTSARDEVE